MFASFASLRAAAENFPASVTKVKGFMSVRRSAFASPGCGGGIVACGGALAQGQARRHLGAILENSWANRLDAGARLQTGLA